MLITVIKDSVIYNGKIYTKDDKPFEANDAIAKSLIERGYVKEANGEGQEPQSLDKMSYQELKKLASEMGLSANGKKEDLIERITASQTNDVEDEDDAEEDSDGISGEATSDNLPNTSMPE